MSTPSQEALVAAARLYVQSRLGDKYEVVGLDEDEDSLNVWQIYVQEKMKPRALMETLFVALDTLTKIANEHLELDHLTGKKEMPEARRARIREEYGDGLDDLFETREE